MKDKYPTYIDWETFEKIQAMLRDNRAEYQHIKSRGIPRDGAALLHGITYCGECGHKMTVRYKGGSQYVCNHLKIQRGAPECQNLRAAPIDAQVAAAFLEAVAPAEIDALSKARKAHLQSERALRHAELARGSAIKRPWRSVSSIAPIPITVWSPANWSDAGKQLYWSCGEPRRRWLSAWCPMPKNPLGFPRICVPR